MENLTGQSLKGYELLDRIGSGGFGVVYRAYQSTIGREVAVKIILPRFANHPDFIRRFEAEAQLIARLEHLHIVPLYDYWRDPDGTYLVMRWLRGGSLKDALSEEPFDLEPAAMLLYQIASGLSVAHSHGVVHRDLKPSNILLDEERNAYLADFGIAMDLHQAADKSSQKEAIVGSLNYLSPEQARSEPVTARSDIYSLGITLYEMLTGENPFHELNTVERLYRHINDPLPCIERFDSSIGDEVNGVIQRATAKNPKHRYADALEMAAAFRSAARLERDRDGLELAELLTLREQDVLHLIVEGQTNQQIAQNLYIEHSTVKWYIRQIYRKLGVRSRRQAIVRAREMKLLMPDAEVDSAVDETTTTISFALPAPVNPYKGLRAFEAADRREYFGREGLVKALLDRLTLPATTSPRDVQPGEGRFLAIVGPSGCGKSSLVKAGLVPALWQGGLPGSERWFVVEMVPGARLVDELEVALIRVAANQADNVRAQLERDKDGLLRTSELILPKDGSELILVIDQFEEIFTLVQDEADRAFFLNLLTAAVTDPRSRVRIILTLRADFYDRPLNYPEFGRLIQNHMETVMPLSAQELEQAIARPAEQVGVTYEPGLVSTIIDDTLYQPGALPLLQYALTELFEQRDGRILTHQAYQGIGGVAGALASRAEESYLEQDGNGQEATRQMFMRLVSVDQQGETLPDTRRRVPASELLSLTDNEELMDELIDIYAAYRLLTLDNDPGSRQPIVEVAHEALLREWERLRLWLEDSRDDLYQHRRLQTLTEEWLANDRDPGLLLRETRLDQFTAWATNTDLVLTGDESAFLKASLDARQDRRAEEEARRLRELETVQKLAETERRRAEEQAMTNVRLRRRALFLVGALVVAAILAVTAIWFGRQAQQEARLATFRELTAAALNNLTIDPERSILLASIAADLAPNINQVAVTEAENVLHQIIPASRLLFTLQGHEDAVRSVVLHPDGRRLFTAGLDGTVQMWDAETGTTLQTLVQGQSPINHLALSPDGQWLASAHVDGTATIWNADTGAKRQALSGDAKSLLTVAFDPNSTRLATAGWNAAIKIWDITTGAQLHQLNAAHTVNSVSFSPDRDLLASASDRGIVQLWDADTGEERSLIEANNPLDTVNVAIFSPDGSRLFTSSSDGTASMWDVQALLDTGVSTAHDDSTTDGVSLLTLYGHEEPVLNIVYSPNETYLATASFDGTAKLWEASTGRHLMTLAGHTGVVDGLAFCPDESCLVTTSWDGTVRVWDLRPSRELLTIPAHQGQVHGLAFSPDGNYLATSGTDGLARVWRLEQSANEVKAVPLLTVGAGTDPIWAVAFNSHGAQLLTAGADRIATIWSLDDDKMAATAQFPLVGHVPGTATFVRGIKSVATSPDGQRIVTAGTDNTARIWNAKTGTELLVVDDHEPVITESGIAGVTDVAYSPDGGLLATSGSDGVVKIRNAETGQALATFTGHVGDVNSVAFSPDGKRLATGGIDSTAKVWDVERGELLLDLSGHNGPVTDVAFHPDGTLLATSGFDTIAKIWDIEAGSPTYGETLFNLSGHTNALMAGIFSPDGTRLATASWDGTVRLYVLPLEELITLAESRVTRPLTPAECRQFLHLNECPNE